MTVWNSALWKMSIQLAKIWPEMVRILKYLIVIWIESEYSLHVAKAQIPIKTRFTWCNFIVSKLSRHCSNTSLSAQTPYLSALDYWKIKLEKSDWINLIFFLVWNWFCSLHNSSSQQYVNQKIKFIQFDFLNSKFQKSSADRHE